MIHNNRFASAITRGLAYSGLILLGSCSRTAQTATTKEIRVVPVAAVAKVTKKDLERVLEIAAEFRPFQEVEVYSKVAGFLKTISVDYGDRVRQGQVLATLEVPELVDQLASSSALIRQAACPVSRSTRTIVPSVAAA